MLWMMSTSWPVHTYFRLYTAVLTNSGFTYRATRSVSLVSTKLKAVLSVDSADGSGLSLMPQGACKMADLRD